MLLLFIECVFGMQNPDDYCYLCCFQQYHDNHMWVALQALEWLHGQGRAHCDLKVDNLRIWPRKERGTICHVTLLDMGGSVKFAGQFSAQCCSCT